MLSKNRRLPVQEALLARPIRIASSSIVSVKQLSPSSHKKNYSRIGVIVGKSVASKATARNRVRRIAFDEGGALAGSLPLGDYLIVMKKPALLLDSASLKREIASVFRQFIPRGAPRQ